MERETLAIIGAGMAGLTLGHLALGAGLTPAVFDKGRKPGGRLATRRLETMSFNHGCQHFTARDAGFAALTAAHGVQPWAAAGDGRLVGMPDMASLAEALAAPVNPLVSTHIHAIKYEDGGWTLTAPSRPSARFAALVLAIPPLQAAALLPPDHRFQAALSSAHLAPSWTVMLDMGDAAGPDTLRLDDGGPLAWIAREASRPGAAQSGAYTIQASARWSTDQLEDSGRERDRRPDRGLCRGDRLRGSATQRARPSLALRVGGCTARRAVFMGCGAETRAVRGLVSRAAA